MQISAPLKVLHPRLYGKLTQGLSYRGSQGKPGARTLLPSWCPDPRSIPNGISTDGLHVSVPSPRRKLSHRRSIGCWNMIRHSTEQQALFRDRHLTVASCRLRIPSGSSNSSTCCSRDGALASAPTCCGPSRANVFFSSVCSCGSAPNKDFVPLTTSSAPWPHTVSLGKGSGPALTFWSGVRSGWGFRDDSAVIICLSMRETQGQSQGGEDPLEEETATCSSVLASNIPWTEEPGRLQSTGLQRDRRDSDGHAHTLVWILPWPGTSFPQRGELGGKGLEADKHTKMPKACVLRSGAPRSSKGWDHA